jgi:sugar diacid utilization regulator
MAAAALGRGVGLDDPSLRAIAYSRQSEEIDAVRRESVVRRETAPAVSRWMSEAGIWTARAPIRVPANRRLELLARVCIPILHDGELLGFLWLIDSSSSLTREQLDTAADFAARIAGALAHERFLAQQQQTEEEDLVRALIGGESLTATARRRLVGARRLAVAVALMRDFDAALAREAAEQQLRSEADLLRRRLSPRRLLSLIEGGRGVFVVADGEVAGDAGEAELRDAFEELCLRLAPAELRVGISGARDREGDLPGAHREASWSAVSVGSAGPRCVTWDSLGADRTLFRLLQGRDPRRLLPRRMRDLLEAEGGGELSLTLAAYLEAGCDSRATAEVLSIHRSTVYQRLGRIEEITGADLRRGADRLDLHLGIRLLRLDSAVGGPP